MYQIVSYVIDCVIEGQLEVVASWPFVFEYRAKCPTLNSPNSTSAVPT